MNSLINSWEFFSKWPLMTKVSFKYVHHWLKHVWFKVHSIIRFTRQPSPFWIWVADGKHVQHIDPCSAHGMHGVRVKQQNALQRAGEIKRLSVELCYLKKPWVLLITFKSNWFVSLLPSPNRANPTWEETNVFQPPAYRPRSNIETWLLSLFSLSV